MQMNYHHKYWMRYWRCCLIECYMADGAYVDAIGPMIVVWSLN